MRVTHGRSDTDVEADLKRISLSRRGRILVSEVREVQSDYLCGAVTMANFPSVQL